MKVIKRDGSSEDVSFDKVMRRIQILCDEYNLSIDASFLAQKVCSRIYDGVKTSDLDEFTSELSISLSTENLDYKKLAGYIIISNNQKNTSPSFSETMTLLYNHTERGLHKPIISEKIYKIIIKHKKKFNNYIKYNRDYLIDYFGFKTLEKSYLTKLDGEIVERVQHMWLRVSIGIHGRTIKKVLETYDMMSQKYFIHASPTLFNAGTPRPQMSSCYLLGTDDSIDGIYKTISDCGKISKWAGGLGVHVSNIRGNGTRINGTNGISNGIIPMLRVYNETARYVDQGGGKRKGAISIYLEPWHIDIEDFIELRKNHGSEHMRCRDLFTALWIPDIFMKRVETGGKWSLFCPTDCPKLLTTYGIEFEEAYEEYEKAGLARKVIEARKLFFSILTSQIETGTPYMLYKDACNRKSNQKNMGIIKSSNLCAEIIEYSDTNYYAVCNLASLSLPIFVENEEIFNFKKLYDVTKIVINNLNKIIDENYYPVPETKRSNMKLRPIGLGVQGLADVFFKMKCAYNSDKAKKLNRNIFETIYYASLVTSCELARKHKPYDLFKGSPMSKGILQFDEWSVEPDMYDWSSLKKNIMEHGLRNSLLTALMPTASTSQILGNYECFECITSNIYVRRTMAGEFIVLNEYLINDLVKLGLWSRSTKDMIIRNNGSIQDIEGIPRKIKEIYKTVWEISQRDIIDMSADRGAFIDQSQSLNLFVADPTFKNLGAMHFYAWKKGLKTGQYYLRTRPKTKAQQFTIKQEGTTEEEIIACSLENKEDCIMCSG